MKAKLFKSVFGKILLPALLGFSLVGCGTPGGSGSDWNSRIGIYTYAQAESELGKPAKTSTLDDGGVFAEWLTRRNVTSPAPTTGLDSGARPGGVDQPLNLSTTPSIQKNEYLDLTFGANGKLSKEEHVYHP
jgi:hypothetical protein